MRAGHEQPVLLFAAEAEVRAGGREMDLADEGSVGREAVHTVGTLARPAGTGPQVAVHVGTDSVRRGGLHVDEHAPVCESVAVHVEHADVGGVFGAVGAPGVDDVQQRLVGAEAQAVGALEV